MCMYCVMVQHGEEFSPAASDLAMVLTRGLSMEQQKSSRDSLQYSSGYSTQTNTPSCSEDTIPSQGNTQSKISTLSLQRPVHTKNNNYNTNYIIIHTNFFLLQVCTAVVVCRSKCSSSSKSGEFWLDVNLLIIQQLEKQYSERDFINIVPMYHYLYRCGVDFPILLLSEKLF